MRTTVQIDEELLARAMAVLGKDTENAIEEALRRVLVHAERKDALMSMIGLGWDGDLDALRQGRVATSHRW